MDLAQIEQKMEQEKSRHERIILSLDKAKCREQEQHQRNMNYWKGEKQRIKDKQMKYKETFEYKTRTGKIAEALLEVIKKAMDDMDKKL